MILDLLLITLIIIFITDLSGVVNHIKSFISKTLTKGRLKGSNWSFHILDCSLCQVFWVGLLYLILSGHLSIWAIAYVCLLSYLTGPLKNLLLFIKDILNKIIDYAYNRTI